VGAARVVAAGAPAAYSPLQIALHWTIAALIVVQLVFNAPMQAAFDDRMDGSGASAGGGALFHIVIGATVLALAVIRLFVRVVRGAPPPHDNPAIITWAAHLTHGALYVMIFAMPLTGLIAWFGSSGTAATLHEVGRLVLIVLIGIHILGGLVEHFVFRNRTLWRMIRATPADG
jgi:cytochrome b561